MGARVCYKRAETKQCTSKCFAGLHCLFLQKRLLYVFLLGLDPSSSVHTYAALSNSNKKPRSMHYRDDSELLYSKVPNFNHFSVVAMLDSHVSL